MVKKGLLPTNESNYHEYIVMFKQLLPQVGGNNLANTLARIHGLLSFSRSIFTSRAVGETFLYFCLHGAATAWILQNELDLSETSAYNALKRLRSMGMLVPSIKITKIKASKGGPRPTIWALEGASAGEVSEALNLHYRMLSPKFMVAREVAQTILEEHLAPKQVMEITYREIIIKVKELRIPFKAPDIAELAAQYLHEQGVKVWR